MKAHRYVKVLALIAVFAISLAIRLFVIDRGLPLYPHPDEKDFIVRTLNMIRRGDLDPGWYGLPGTTFMYLLYPLYLLYYLIVAGSSSTWASFVPNVMDTYQIARGLNIALSLAAVGLTFLLARKIFKNFHIALLSAALLSFAPLFMDYGTLTRTDILAMVFILWAALFFYDAIQAKSRKKLFWASIITGFALGTRYHAIVAALPLGIWGLIEDFSTYKVRVAEFGRYLWDSLRIKTFTAIAVVSVIGGFIIANPYTLIHYETTRENILFESRVVHPGAERLPGILNWLWYVPNVLIEGAGSIPLFLFAVIGGLILVTLWYKKKSLPSLFLFMFPILFYAFIASANLRWARWMLPILPYEAVLAAFGIFGVVTFLQKKSSLLRKISQEVLFWLLGIMIFALNFVNLTQWAMKIRGNTVDAKIIEWIETNIQPAQFSTVSIEGLQNTKLEKFAQNKGIQFFDASRLKPYTDTTLRDFSTYVIVAKNVSKSLFCYPLPVAGTVEKGDLLCTKGVEKDATRIQGLESQYELVKTIEKKTSRGLSVDIYEKIK